MNSRVAAGALLIAGGLISRSKLGLAIAAAGGALVAVDAVELFDGKDHAGTRSHRAASVARAATFGIDQEQLFDFWSSPEYTARVTPSIESIEVRPDGRWLWHAKPVMSHQLSWETALVESHRPNLIHWRSVAKTPVEHEGKLKLRPAPGNRGTEAILTLTWSVNVPLGGATNPLVAKGTAIQASEALRRAKQLIETGYITTAQR